MLVRATLQRQLQSLQAIVLQFLLPPTLIATLDAHNGLLSTIMVMATHGLIMVKAMSIIQVGQMLQMIVLCLCLFIWKRI